jgi:hypothetical protein
VRTVIQKCLSVKEGDDVVVVVDPATRAIGDALRDEAAAAGADAVLIVMNERATHGTEPPPAVAALAACDVFIAPTSKSLSHTRARKRATDNGARGATMPGVTEDMLARVMAVDFDTMAAVRRFRASAARVGVERGFTRSRRAASDSASGQPAVVQRLGLPRRSPEPQWRQKARLYQTGPHAAAFQRIATGPGGPPAVPTKGSGDAQRSIS